MGLLELRVLLCATKTEPPQMTNDQHESLLYDFFPGLQWVLVQVAQFHPSECRLLDQQIGDRPFGVQMNTMLDAR